LSFKKDLKAPNTEFNFYKIGKVIGKGAFGKVNLGLHKLTRKVVAMKSVKKD
jgi:serine/threonine protein kinase